ncbi:hypothetical protein RFI_30649, partial [Reticulomyxa filosa]
FVFFFFFDYKKKKKSMKIWVQLLWEDFPPNSAERTALNSFISKLIKLSASPPSAQYCHTATQILLAAYRDQFLKEQKRKSIKLVPAPWPNVLSAKLSVPKPSDSSFDTILSQFQCAYQQNDMKELLEIYVLKEGNEQAKHTSSLSMIQPKSDTKATNHRGHSFSLWNRSKSTFIERQTTVMEQEGTLIAGQLTLMMDKLLKAIRPPEFLGKALFFFFFSPIFFLLKKKKIIRRGGGGGKNGIELRIKNWTGSKGPNIIALRQLGECISIWVRLMIACQKHTYRKAMVERVFEIGIAMKKLQNVYGQLQIYGALDHPLVGTER